MLALYRSGRQAEALDASTRRAARCSSSELGIDPSPRAAASPRVDPPAGAALDTVAVSPPPRRPFDEIAGALLEGRLVLVLGTEVAELAHRLAERFRFPDGCGAELTRVAEYVALMKGSGPLYDELHELLSIAGCPDARSIARSRRSPPSCVSGEPGTSCSSRPATTSRSSKPSWTRARSSTSSPTSHPGRDGGKFCHFAPDGTARVDRRPEPVRHELDLGRRTVILKLHGSVDPGPERAWESFVVTEDDYLDYLPEGDLARRSRWPWRRTCGGATSSSSATRCRTGTSASS